MSDDRVYVIEFERLKPVRIPSTSMICRSCGFIEHDPDAKRCELCRSPFDPDDVRLRCDRRRRCGVLVHKDPTA